MGMYRHITKDERRSIATLLWEDYDHEDIAKSLGRAVSTVTREISRNSKPDGTYDARYAHKLASRRRKQSKTGCRIIENNPILERTLAASLTVLSSPEAVSHEDNIPVSTQTIYTWIYRSRTDLKASLPYRGKKRRRYGSNRSLKQGWTRHVKHIDERPAAADDRSETGHFEGDTIHDQCGGLLTYTDRRSRFEKVGKIDRRQAGMVATETKRLFKDDMVRSITNDRGSEFSLWQQTERDLNTAVYFADPRSPWQRGTNENTNGRLRRVFPKGTDFSIIPQSDIDAIVWIMNHTRRKVLSWCTPCEVYEKCCASS